MRGFLYTTRAMKPLRLPALGVLVAFVLVASIAGCAATDEAIADRCGGLIDPDLDPACAASSRWSPQWREARTMLPAAPRTETLLRIEAPRGQGGYEYFIDPDSLSLGTDGVMRYTVVARSPSGASTAFHEGMRCHDDTVRTFGYTGSDGIMRPIAGDQWRVFASRGSRGYQDYLRNVIMCDKNGHAWAPEKAVQALRAQYTAGGVRIERQCMNDERCGIHNRHDY
jgi:hypothetical protein